MNIAGPRIGLALAGAALIAAPLQAQDVLMDIEDPSEQKSAPVELSPEFSAALPDTVSIAGNQAAQPAPVPQADYPLNVEHWEDLSQEGQIATAGILVDGLKTSGTFETCDTIDGESMAAGITEWMTRGDRTEAVMTVAAFIAYSVCPVAVP